ncbi:MAG: tRNA (adenine(22)-N(1))-methyltransferase TrmK [Bdellovibrionaceae bacterium]|nr:tRNA (adenine(22)-N(1))-methyltransferase TrmK [Pseudobdellovibrionaceae bacterium]
MTPRLKYLLSKADPARPLWDIGCDHGYLGEGALLAGFPRVEFVDPAAHLVDKLKRRLAFRFGNTGYHALRGQDLAAPVTGNIVMAGFGGDQMREILEAWLERGLLREGRLILSPHKDEDKLRAWIEETFTISEQSSFDERGRVRPIFVCEQK